MMCFLVNFIFWELIMITGYAFWFISLWDLNGFLNYLPMFLRTTFLLNGFVSFIIHVEHWKKEE